MNRVVHFEIQADDINRAKKFYQNVLGWEIEQAMTKEKGGMNYWLVRTAPEGSKELGINGGLYERSSTTDKSFLYDCTIAVADIDKAIEAVKANGGTITREKMNMEGVGLFARAKDTEGNSFGLMQPTDWQPK